MLLGPGRLGTVVLRMRRHAMFPTPAEVPWYCG